MPVESGEEKNSEYCTWMIFIQISVSTLMRKILINATQSRLSIFAYQCPLSLESRRSEKACLPGDRDGV